MAKNKIKKNLNPLLSLAIALSLGVLAIWFLRMIQTDNPLSWAKEDYPLGEKQSYVILRNKEIATNDGEIVLEEGTYYTFVVPGEIDQQPMTAGRQVGRSNVNLEPFLGKEVYITGDFYEGRPLVLDNKPLPAGYTWDKMIVMHIENIKEK